MSVKGSGVALTPSSLTALLQLSHLPRSARVKKGEISHLPRGERSEPIL